MSKALRLKGHCNRLIAIHQLPVHQREVSFGGFSFWFEEGEQRMNGFGFIALLVLIGFSACSPGVEVSEPAKFGSLSCFSVAPGKADPTAQRQDIPSCDALCAAYNAVCTGMQNGGMNPPIECGDPAPNASFGVCRCCAVKP